MDGNFRWRRSDADNVVFFVCFILAGLSCNSWLGKKPFFDGLVEVVALFALLFGFAFLAIGAVSLARHYLSDRPPPSGSDPPDDGPPPR